MAVVVTPAPPTAWIAWWATMDQQTALSAELVTSYIWGIV